MIATLDGATITHQLRGTSAFVALSVLNANTSGEELAYLNSQRPARLATVSTQGPPIADAVGFEFDGERFSIGGHNLPGTRK